MIVWVSLLSGNNERIGYLSFKRSFQILFWERKTNKKLNENGVKKGGI